MFDDGAVGRIDGTVGIVACVIDDIDFADDVAFAICDELWVVDDFIVVVVDCVVVAGAMIPSVLIDGVAKMAPSKKLPVILIIAVCQPR